MPSRSVSQAAPDDPQGSRQSPREQTVDAQSPFTAQALPVAHPPQVPPPQSRSVSAPFFFPSVQVGAWHVRGADAAGAVGRRGAGLGLRPHERCHHVGVLLHVGDQRVT